MRSKLEKASTLRCSEIGTQFDQRRPILSDNYCAAEASGRPKAERALVSSASSASARGSAGLRQMPTLPPSEIAPPVPAFAERDSRGRPLLNSASFPEVQDCGTFANNRLGRVRS